jgi:broad specificity phosphatase PhoE
MTSMRTTLYLIRHAATPANLMKPSRLQGRRSDPELAPVGLHQAYATRDFLAIRPIDVIYSSPLRRAYQTATIIAEPHELTPLVLDSITECDVGEWEGKSWEEIREQDPVNYERYHADPGSVAYLGGENFRQVYDRSANTINELFHRHRGLDIAVVSHHVVNRTYLAGVLGLGPSRARAVSLSNCGISIIVQDHGKIHVQTLNADFHLQGVA